MLDSWLQDVRYAVRLVRRNPLFSLTAAISLAIGIGANTTIFTIANALLFKPPAGVVEPGRLVDVGRSQDGEGFDNSSYPNYLDVRARNTVFSDLYAFRSDLPMSLGGAGGAERIYGNLVTQNYFSIVGARPAVGRFFSTANGEAPGASPVLVLSHRLWTRRFHADPAIIGQVMPDSPAAHAGSNHQRASVAFPRPTPSPNSSVASLRLPRLPLFRARGQHPR